LQWLMSPGASLWWACLLPRGCVARSVYSVGNKHIGRLNMCKGWVLVKVRIVGYLRVGGVVNSSPSMLSN